MINGQVPPSETEVGTRHMPPPIGGDIDPRSGTISKLPASRLTDGFLHPSATRVRRAQAHTPRAPSLSSATLDSRD
jgi:hypothetical protein